MLYPMFAMIVLTSIVGVMVLSVRVKSVKAGQVRLRSLKLMENEGWPELVQKTTNNFSNQFEIPMLFYVAGVAYLALGIDSLVGLVAAWCFVVFRVIHAYIHITYNHILHRLTAFWLAFMAVLVMWINLLVIAG